MFERTANGRVNTDHLDSLSNYPDQLPNQIRHLIVLINGLMPGTGASTLEKILAKMLDLEPVGAGRYRRAIALEYAKAIQIAEAVTQVQDSQFNIFDNRQKNRLHREVWREFLQRYFTRHGELLPIDGLQVKLEDLMLNNPDQLYDEKNLLLFMDHQRRYGLKSNHPLIQHVSKNLDLIPDLIAYRTLTSPVKPGKRGRVYEGKLSLVSQDIAQHNLNPEDLAHLPALNNSETVAVGVALTVDEVESARRVLHRGLIEGSLTPPGQLTSDQALEYLLHSRLPADLEDAKSLTMWIEKQIQRLYENNKTRMTEDYRRWTDLYKLPLDAEFLQTKADLVIDTTHLTEETIVWEVFKEIAARMPELAAVLLGDLSRQLHDEHPLIHHR